MSIDDLDSGVASFRSGASSALNIDKALPRRWSDNEWNTLFQFTTLRRVSAGKALIQHGEADRTLYFVLRGSLEVILRSGDGIGMGSVLKEGPGTVLGELSFFDGKGRAASVWAIKKCEVAAMTPEQYAAFEQAYPELSRDLIFALGRILAARLRRAAPKAAA